MRKAIYIIVFISFHACSSNNKTDNHNSDIQGYIANNDENLLGIINKTDTLKIFVEFSECGEWGGHRESILLKRNENNKVLAHLLIDSISCERLETISSETSEIDKSRILIIEKEKILNVEDQQKMTKFIMDLLELYLKSNYSDRNEDSLIIYRNSGSLLKVSNSDFTFNLTFWNIDNYAKTNYSKMRDQIFNEK